MLRWVRRVIIVIIFVFSWEWSFNFTHFFIVVRMTFNDRAIKGRKEDFPRIKQPGGRQEKCTYLVEEFFHFWEIIMLIVFLKFTFMFILFFIRIEFQILRMYFPGTILNSQIDWSSFYFFNWRSCIGKLVIFTIYTFFFLWIFTRKYSIFSTKLA